MLAVSLYCTHRNRWLATPAMHGPGRRCDEARRWPSYKVKVVAAEYGGEGAISVLQLLVPAHCSLQHCPAYCCCCCCCWCDVVATWCRYAAIKMVASAGPYNITSFCYPDCQLRSLLDSYVHFLQFLRVPYAQPSTFKKSLRLTSAKVFAKFCQYQLINQSIK